ncbi:MAG: ABC transporter permease [Spirochaetales bacterium]|nr:ABC transporter permease [Spirochaetales bacterium]
MGTRDLRLFWAGALLSYKALFRWFRPSTYLASKVVMPVAQMIFFTLIGTFGGGDPLFFVVGNAMQIAAISGIYGITMSIGGDRWDGTLAYLFGSPAGRLTLFFGRSAIHVLDGFIGVAVAFLWGGLLFDLRLSALAAGSLAVTVLAAVLGTSGMGLLMGCIGLISRNVMFVNNTVYFLLLFLSGANVPVESLPTGLQAVASWVPLTHAIAAARLIVAGAGLSRPVAALVAQEVGIGLLYLGLGYALFRAFERRAKTTGSLETM